MSDLVEFSEYDKQVVLKNHQIIVRDVYVTVPTFNGSGKYKADFNSLGYSIKDKPKKSIKKHTCKDLREKRVYTVNKKRLTDRIYSFFQLRKSKIFCAFYTISFPMGFSDASGFRVLNNVLTSLRAKGTKFQYVWVAERQKNGTIHFHILLNKWFNVSIVNLYCKKAIRTELKKEGNGKIEFSFEKYNGCDVKRVFNSKGMRGYITKYVSKNTDTFEGRCWSCDYITSSLFTSISLRLGELGDFSQLLNYYPDGNVKDYKCDFATVYTLQHMYKKREIKPLWGINQLIADQLEYTGKKVKYIKYEYVENEIINKEIEQLNLLF